MDVLNFVFSKLYVFIMGVFDAFYQSLIYDNRYKFILEGVFNTLIIALFSVIVGVLIGVIVALIRDIYDKHKKLRFLNTLVKWYVDVIRGTPVILQLMIIYYVVFKSVDVPATLVGILAFGINSGAYVSEIIRAGIQSIPKCQIEAGYALGFKYVQIMRYIILPQAIKNVLPALGNEFITLIKETSVGAYIGILELTKASDIIASRTYDYFFPLILVAIIYFVVTFTLSKGVNKLERKLNHVRG